MTATVAVAAADQPVIALISGVAASIPPAMEAVRSAVPDAVLWNLLDDRLITDAVEAGGVTPHLTARMNRLLDHAAAENASAVLLTCSLYSELAADATERLGIPVLAPDDAAFASVVTLGVESVAIVSGVPLALRDSIERARTHFAGTGMRAHPTLAAGAREPSLAGDAGRTADAILSAMRTTEPVGALLLANYSLALAAPLLRAELDVPVIVGTTTAAAAIRDRLTVATRKES